MRPRVLLAFFPVVIAVSPGCRCSGAPPEPVPEARSAPTVIRCPPPPDWAAKPPPNVDHMLVELIYRPLPEANRPGTGMRVFDDGLVQTFDDKLITVVGNKPKADSIPPGWRWHSKLPHQDVLDALKAEIAAQPAAELEDLQGNKHLDTKQPPAVLTVRRGGKLLRSCWLGSDGNGPQMHVEEALRKVVGDVPGNDPKDPIDQPPPAASSLPKP